VGHADRLTLRQALDEDRLPEFIAQEERSDPDPDPEARAKFDRVLRTVVKPEKATGRTSRSRIGDDSSGNRTRRGKAASSRR
jgi:hypothetical protein